MTAACGPPNAVRRTAHHFGSLSLEVHKQEPRTSLALESSSALVHAGEDSESIDPFRENEQPNPMFLRCKELEHRFLLPPTAQATSSFHRPCDTNAFSFKSLAFADAPFNKTQPSKIIDFPQISLMHDG